jgi:hypothetical protein
MSNNSVVAWAWTFQAGPNTFSLPVERDQVHMVGRECHWHVHLQIVAVEQNNEVDDVLAVTARVRAQLSAEGFIRVSNSVRGIPANSSDPENFNTSSQRSDI